MRSLPGTADMYLTPVRTGILCFNKAFCANVFVNPKLLSTDNFASEAMFPIVQSSLTLKT